MTGEASVRSAILSWERLRVAFNIVLLVEGLFLSINLIDYFGGIVPWAFWIVVFSLTANAWFSFGVLAEIYWITFRKTGFGAGRYWLFGLFLLGGMIYGVINEDVVAL